MRAFQRAHAKARHLDKTVVPEVLDFGAAIQPAKMFSTPQRDQAPGEKEGAAAESQIWSAALGSVNGSEGRPVDLRLSQMFGDKGNSDACECARLNAVAGAAESGTSRPSTDGPLAQAPNAQPELMNLSALLADHKSLAMPNVPAHMKREVGAYLSASQDTGMVISLSESGRVALAAATAFATPPPNNDTQPLIVPRHTTPFPMLSSLRAATSEIEGDEAAPHRPGYATPMRTSVVELMSLLASSTLSDESDASFDSMTSTPELTSPLQASAMNPILEYRNRNLLQTPERPRASDEAPGSAPSKLSHKPKLSKVRSAMDGIGTSPVMVRDPFQWIKPSTETAWDSIQFESSPPLGDGNEGKVMLARFHGVLVAVKVGHHERILKEQKMMSKLQHPRVLRTLGHAKRANSAPSSSSHEHALLAQHSTRSVSYAAIYEYCPNKDLMTYLSKNNTRTDVVRMTQIFDDILAGLEYIHDNHPNRSDRGSIVHGDVKPENVMIDQDGRAKIGDFGLAQYQSRNMDVQGTPSYIAPEIVQDFLASAEHPQFTTKADIFSFGVLMVVALTGHYPFKRLTAKLHSGNMTAAQVIKHFTPGRRTLKTINDISPRFKRMVDSCLCRYPEMRPSAAQLRALLFRRSQSTGQDTAVPPAALVRAASSITQEHLNSLAEERHSPSPTTVAPPAMKLPPTAVQPKLAHDKVEMTAKVPASLQHLVLGPQPHFPVSSGKLGDDEERAQ
jgi:serine/threonine protein kinase